MKVKIGPYLNFWGPYQIADLLQYVGVSEERCDDLGAWLATTWVNRFTNWIYNNRQRTIKVRIDNYDLWDMDSTLAKIVYPMLLKLKENKPGSPHVDDEDVPENIRSTAAAPKENEYDTDEFWHDRWDYVLDEMIWAFEQINKGNWEEEFYTNMDGGVYKKYASDFRIDKEGMMKTQKRITNGLTLFGKYYQGLWT